MIFTTRFAPAKAGPDQFEHVIPTLGISQTNGHPGHPQTQGKIERFHQTLKRWLAARPPPTTLAEPASPTGRLHARLQPRTPPPRDRQTHPSNRPRRHTPSHALDQRRRTPLPNPLRPHRRLRRHHHPPRRQTTPPRHRPRPQTPPRHRPDQRTPTPSPSTAPPEKSSPNTPSTPTSDYQPKKHKKAPPEGGGPVNDVLRHLVNDVLRHHSVGLTGFEPATP